MGELPLRSLEREDWHCPPISSTQESKLCTLPEQNNRVGRVFWGAGVLVQGMRSGKLTLFPLICHVGWVRKNTLPPLTPYTCSK